MSRESHSAHSPATMQRFHFSGIMIGFVAVILILSSITGLFVQSLLSKVKLTDLVIHTHHVLQQIERLLKDLSDAESAALSYSLAGSSHYLPPYHTNLASAADTLKQLHLLVENNESQSRQLKRVEDAMLEQQRVMDLLVALPHSHQVDESHLQSEDSLVMEGVKAMDAFRNAAEAMQEEEEELLTSRSAALEQTRTNMMVLLLICIVTTTIIIGWLFRRIWLDAVALTTAQAALKHSHGQLEIQVNERTVDLVAANDRLSLLSGKILQVQEAERRRIAYDMHDEIGHTLAAMKLRLQDIRDRIEDRTIVPLINESSELIGSLLHRVRNLAMELRPCLMDELGLHEALKWHVRQFAQRSGLTITFNTEGILGRLSEETEIVCFRLLQETLTNVLKHARATSVAIAVKQTTYALELTIRDNGVGFSPNEARARTHKGESFGLLSMEERVRLVGGGLTINSTIGEGTQVTATIPIKSVEVAQTAPEEITL